MASDVKYDVLENVNPDLSDSEFIDVEVPDMDAPTPGFDAPTPAADADGGDEDEDGGPVGAREEDEEPEGDIDEELAAELDLALGDDGDVEDEEDEDEDDEEDESDEDDDDDEELVQARKLLNEEIRDLEAAVNKKRGEIASSANPLIKVSLFAFIRVFVCDSNFAHALASAPLRGCPQKASSGLGHEDGTKGRDEGEVPSPERGYHLWRRRRRC